MESLAEKRVFDGRGGSRSCFVASETGLVYLRVSQTGVGEFSLADRRSATDVSAGPNGIDSAADGGTLLAVATDEDVLVSRLGRPSDVDPDSITLEPTDFGSAVAVDVTPSSIVAADQSGTCFEAETGRDGSVEEWTAIDWPVATDGERPSVTAIESPLVGTDRGVFQLVDGTARPAGLDAVTALETTLAPLVGTADGLYALGNGWMERFDGPVDALSVSAATQPDTLSTVLASGTDLYATADPTGDPSWDRITSTDYTIADLAHVNPGVVCAVTTAGTTYVADSTESSRHPLGIADPRAIVVCGGSL
ncbi:HVO_0234 family beta-propeller protein [Halovivax gelatinilyticus]|uniref:HVO_0234 family beta-propeller protein n=1 Tax=Halovivax gelatinilyticus TaxID=2961597 RepID=UPI0020CA68B4|nr:hypothetical protein [Halovivax gelatinilyticus]